MDAQSFLDLDLRFSKIEFPSRTVAFYYLGRPCLARMNTEITSTYMAGMAQQIANSTLDYLKVTSTAYPWIAWDTLNQTSGTWLYSVRCFRLSPC